MLQRAEKDKMIEKVEKEKIFIYDLQQAEIQIRKGNNRIKVLYELLFEEINKHNGIIFKKVNKIRNQGTID